MDDDSFKESKSCRWCGKGAESSSKKKPLPDVSAELFELRQPGVTLGAQVVRRQDSRAREREAGGRCLRAPEDDAA